MLALAEMRRAKVRFGLLVGAVALLVFLLLFQQTLAGTLLGYFTGALERQSAEVLVFGEDARRNVEGSVILPGTLEAVMAVPGVREAAPLGEGTFTVRTSQGLADAVIFGYRPGGPGAPMRIAAGRLPQREMEAVASAVDADAGFGIGDRVEVLPGGVTFTVVGLVEDARFAVLPTLFTAYDGYVRAVLAANPDAERVLPSLLAVDPIPGVPPERLAARITARVEGVEALDRETAVSSLPGVSAIRSSFGIVLALGFVVVVLVIGFFFLILTVQKTQALAMLRAIGAGTGYLLRALALQVTFVTVAGIALAAALLATVAAVSGDAFPISADPGLIAATGGAVLVLALLASLASLRRIARLDPTAAASRGGAGGLA